MSPITIETIEEKQTELGALIQQFKQQSQGTTIQIDAGTVELRHGEHYAGAVLDSDGNHKHHLILMAQKPDRHLNWQAAMVWAKNVGGALPNRQEQALLFANCEAHLAAEWHWSSETHEDASGAWYCYFDNGTQTDDRKSFEGCAVAVRRT